MRGNLILISLFVVLLMILCLMLFAEESQNLHQKQVKGFVIWESNRTGQWELYRANLDGSDSRQLTELAKMNPLPYNEYLRPRVSPDGKLVLFGYGKQNAPSEVWIIPSKGGEPKKLTVGNPLNWSTDGKSIYFVRDSKVWQYKLETGEESIIYDKPVPVSGREGSMVGDITPNLKSAVFRSPKANEYFVFDKGETIKTTGGCEPSFTSDGKYMYWVQGPKDFRIWDVEKDVEQQLLGTPDYEKWNYTYFPRISRDCKWLTFGASPDQHDHNTSDYEIFIQELKDMKPIGKPIRITNDPRTDRWGDIFVYVDDTPPTVPLNVKAEHDGQGVKLFWDTSQDSESDVLCYNIYRSTKAGDYQLLAKVEGTSYSDYATNARTRYQYVITAVNYADLESPKSKPVTITTRDIKPISPESLKVIVRNNQAYIKWNPNPELDIKGYNVYRSNDPEAKFKKINTKIVSGTSYVDSSVETEKIYYYYVTAVDNSGQESQRSNVFSKKIMERTKDGLLALYLFDEGKGNIITDDSGIEPPIHLRITDPTKILWTKDENAVEITGNSMIVSEGNIEKILNNLKGRKELSIEVWFAPNNLNQTGPARIVSMSVDPTQRNFTLGQINDDIAFRLRTTKTDQNGIPELDTQKHILKQSPTHLVATYDGNIKRLYVNGNLHSEIQQITGDFSNWNNYPLVIGNELTGDRPWLGKLYLVGIYNRQLNPDEVQKNYQAGI